MSGYYEILEKFREEGRLRKIPPHRSHQNLYDLCSNDYMGLAKDAVQSRHMKQLLSRWPDISMTSSASRLLATNQEVFSELEEALAKAYRRPALLYNSGYHANIGLVSALNIPGTLWLTDKLIHASVIDGIRMSSADCKRWQHNDISHLRKIIETEYDKYDSIIVVCESIYSMDGDAAPLSKLVELKQDFDNVLLYVDEAHAFGACGPEGLGIASELGITDCIDILVGTLGKACASVGAFVITSPEIREYLVNCSRSLIFSTAIAPANAAWSILMFEQLRKMDTERAHLKEISLRFKNGIEEITGQTNPSVSAVVPLITGNSERAIAISKILEMNGVLALPIRRPTVPPGGERIRFSLHAGLSMTDIDKILQTIGKAFTQTK